MDGMDHTDHMQQSIDLAVSVIRGTPVDRYDDPSPCADFTVRQVVNHIAFGFVLAQRSATREPWDATWKLEDGAPFLIGVPESDWADRCAEEGAATARAWAEPGVWDGDSHMGGSPMPAAAIGSMMTSEFAVHAWDVAAATGRGLDVPDELGQVVLDGVLAIAPMGRDGGWFGAEVPVADDAPAFVKALGAAGRDPGWKA
ncbi:MAG: TIGR03086 family protein [Pseudonocardiaceae bacterium]|nr:MAG: TIGR03086 family protein [Pseudonocardiaceae bacterium]